MELSQKLKQARLDAGNDFGDKAMAMFGPYEEMTVYRPGTAIPDKKKMAQKTQLHLLLGNRGFHRQGHQDQVDDNRNHGNRAQHADLRGQVVHGCGHRPYEDGVEPVFGRECFLECRGKRDLFEMQGASAQQHNGQHNDLNFNDRFQAVPSCTFLILHYTTPGRKMEDRKRPPTYWEAFFIAIFTLGVISFIPPIQSINVPSISRKIAFFILLLLL